jgi:Uncharacterized protein conserved in bacteria (DUF2252)
MPTWMGLLTTALPPVRAHLRATLARAHARSGDAVAIAEYLGGTGAFGEAITDFSHAYADQNEQYYAEFVAAVRSGRLKAVEGV